MSEVADRGICEDQQTDCKSLRLVTGHTANFDELAHDCVAFANGAGGRIVIGVEDGEAHPPADQRVEPSLLDRIRKRVGELTVNVQVLPALQRDRNGGEYVIVSIPRSVGVASTSDGRYFVRVGDACRPVVGDDVLRLADERPAVPWETMTSLGTSTAATDRTKLAKWTATIRASGRVNASVKEKSDQELLDHYALARGGTLTNLGVLLLGTAAERAKLGSAPIVQALKFDERGEKVSKQVWDDDTLSPIELIDAIWASVPGWRSSTRDGCRSASRPGTSCTSPAAGTRRWRGCSTTWA